MTTHHAHIRLVRLNICLGDGLKLGGRGGIEKLLEDGNIELDLCPGDETLQVGLVDGTDGVDVGRGTVVFGQVSSEG